MALVLHIPGVEHLPAILAPVIAHDFAFYIMVTFQGFNWFYSIPLRQGLTSDQVRKLLKKEKQSDYC
jgi:ABC-type microcin C transport system permease subunit YejB